MSDAPKEAAPKKSKKLLFVVLGVVVLAAAGGGFMMMKAKKAKEDSEESAQVKAAKPPIFIQMDDFLVNLPGRGGEHFLQTRVVLRTSDPQTEGRIKTLLPMIRDRLLTVLSQRPMEVLVTVEGKSALTRDMALVINALLDPQLTMAYAMSRDPTGAELRNLEKMGVINTAALATRSASSRSLAKMVEVTEADLPVQAVLFSSFIMQ